MNEMKVEFTPELKAKLQPGNKIKVHYGPGNPNNELRHILAIVDDEYVVYKVWSRNKKRYRYSVEWFYDFLLLEFNNNMKVIK